MKSLCTEPSKSFHPKRSVGLDSFESAITNPPNSEGEWHLTADPEWGQGRAAFGGLVVGAMVKAAGENVGSDKELRTLMVSFIAPVEPGISTITIQTLRSGRTITHLQAKVWQAETLRASGLLSYAIIQDSTPFKNMVKPAVLPPPEEVPTIPMIVGVTPTFFQHYEHKWTLGDVPFSGGERAEYEGWLRFRGESENAPWAKKEHVASLMDAWPSPILQVLPGRSMISTVTLKVEFFPLTGQTPANSWWRYHSVSEAFESGLDHFTARLYSETGVPVAIGHQTVAVFEPRS